MTLGFRIAAALAVALGTGYACAERVPLLMLLGEKDDWTPAATCIALVDRMRQQHPEADLTVRVYADSYHGFDRKQPVRLLRDVSTGVNPAGVHNGGNPAARAAALAELDAFLISRVLQAPAR